MSVLWGLLLGVARFWRGRFFALFVSLAGEIVAALPEGIVGRCFDLVRVAEANAGLESAAKFEWVVNELRVSYPELRESTMNALIELVVSAVHRGLDG